MRSYTAAVPVDEAAARALDRYARRFSRAVRWAFAQVDRRIRKGLPAQSKAERKSEVVERFGLTSRQANAVLAEADGKREAQKELDKLNAENLSHKVRKKMAQLKTSQAKLGQHLRYKHKPGKTSSLSKEGAQKLAERVYLLQSSLARLKGRLTKLQAQVDSGLTHMTFGTKDLLRQRPLEKSETFTKRALRDWRKAWDLARNGQFLVLGSKDETGGCQGCVATMERDGSVSLRVRLPESEGGGYVHLTGVKFAYGTERLRYALAQQAVRATSKVAKLKELHEAQGKANGDAADAKPKLSQKDIEGGTAITWRFMRQADNSWRVCFTTEVESVKATSNLQIGAIGVDFNAGFVTVTEADRFGNLMHSHNLMTPTVGRSSEQRTAALAEAVKSIMVRCIATCKPLMLEDLDFAKKKKSESLSPKSRRTVSALAYAEFKRLCLARAHDAGVEVLFVDPAYTSTQGLVRYARQRGWSVHQAAAGVIARRGLGFRERAPVSGTLRVPVAGVAVAWKIPEDFDRNSVRQRWPELHLGIRKAIALHFRNRRVAGWREPAKPALCSSKVTGELPVLKRPLRAPA